MTDIAQPTVAARVRGIANKLVYHSDECPIRARAVAEILAGRR